MGEATSNPIRIRSYEVIEDYGRIWPPPKPFIFHLLSPFKFCGYLYSDDLPRSTVIANGWTRRSCIREARALWFDHVRFVTEDNDCSIFCRFLPAQKDKPGV